MNAETTLRRYLRYGGLLIACSTFAFAVDAQGQVLHVDVNGPGGSGATWGTALTDLQAALDGVIPGTTIKVAQGTYIPSLRTDAGDTRTATFLINLDIIIEGGYVGWDAPDPNLRDPDAFPTILSGALEAGLLRGTVRQL